ncbi:hypothetical protein BAUCODRAFT_72201 [Baudoinia panamericana UAMH 10762]|uniref:Xylanolytic transcriptional activator regulatory domain-containing protein n=1 Tax=Baudoinia panamericana (strain UAMH 10762) TaxID=717646 RepID=M2LMH3_BAUPA|nr:uncharacterized protein BAUCODRAFT_72201 [Baudoinia panamericana UAMH 10762]EMC95497.1 hypothetical protein BAUCODRAFT_72201 [Baudoinia panamericana UAMH 10762]
MVVSVEGAKAFETSVWHWVPNAADTGAAGEPDPSVIPADVPHGPDEDCPYTSVVLARHLCPKDRDRVLSVILDHCDKSNIVRIATTFPSHSILESFLRTALHHQAVRSPTAWIHVPTFSTKTARDCLLCALIACGAFMSPVPAAQTMGAAMPELILAFVNALWAQNNALTRDLQVCQTYALIQHIMFWSGSKRRMEIAESTQQPLVTIIRRSGMLAVERGDDLTPPTFTDGPDELDRKWREWAQRESRIRLVHHTFVHNAQISMTQFVNPLMTCSEMDLPLPANESLWSAATPEEWRACWHASGQSSHEPSSQVSASGFVRQALLDAHCGQAYAEQRRPRSALAPAYAIYGLWDSIWTYSVGTTWLCWDNLQFQAAPLGLSPRQELLVKVLEDFGPQDTFPTARNIARLGQPVGLEKHPHETIILIHHMCLFLFAPLKDMPVFAGKDGALGAHRVHPRLQEWTQTPAARRSLWHATQIFRHVRLLRRAQIQNAVIVALYQASLTLWTFGIVAGAAKLKAVRSGVDDTTTLTGPRGKEFRLDGEMSSQVESFVALGTGSPTISTVRRGRDTVIPVLYSPGAMMDAAVHLCTPSPTQHSAHTAPSFTRIVTGLMEDLSKAALGVGFA